jgi:hypothetical protein
MAERDDIRRRVVGTLLTNAILRWESFATLLVTLILFVGVGDFQFLGATLPAWSWLVLGALTEGALVLSTMTDPEEAQQALAREFESKYDLATIRNSVSRERLRNAMEYRRNMLKLAKSHSGSMRLNLVQTVDEVNTWITHMYDLARHIDGFESNELVERDIRMVPQQIEKTRVRIERETDARVKEDLERQLRQLEQQKLNLEQTRNSVKRAEIQLESTLASLGTIYAQMSHLGTKEVDSARAQRLRLEIQDEVASLQDTLDAMDEVQMQKLNL